MSTHLTDDELILHFYGEDAADAGRVDAHLASCADCHANWSTLQRTMQMVDTADVDEAPAGFERVMWARVQPHLPARAATTPWWSPRVWAPAAGLAAVIGLAFLGGRFWPHPPASATPAASEADAKTTRERVLLTALGDHFEQTEQLLVELKNLPEASEIDFRTEQRAARDLVSAGRLYRETANENGDVALASVLEDLERVLVDVASSNDHVTTTDLQSLRARMEDDNLLFKVRALTNAVREREKTLSMSGKSVRTL